MTRVLQARRLLGIIAILVMGVLLTACGGENGEEDPTATSAPADAQPTVASAEIGSPSATGTPEVLETVPANIDMSTASLDTRDSEIGGTPAGIAASTSSPTPAMGVSTPPAAAASPVSTVPPSGPAAATPGTPGEIEGAMPAAPPVGDGTTGAMVEGTPAVVAGAVAATPVASPASPIAQASPVAPLVVSGCDVAEVPPFTGEQATYRLTTDLNFRAGPGAECDLALEDPIGVFQTVEIIGGPVVRADDGSEWVQARVLDTEGWLALEFLEPVEE